MTKPILSAHASDSLLPTTNPQATAPSLLEMTDAECIDYIVGNGIEIPEDFMNSPELGSIIKSILQDIETDPNREFAFSYYKTQVFAESIREFVINQSTLSQSQETSTNSSIMATASYTLQDNTQYGSWQSNYPNYNCYSYSIGYLENDYYKDRGRYPGQMSGRSFSMSLSIYQMALSVKYDLEAIGYGSVYISNVRPMVLSPNETLISIRKGSSDYHFMKYHPSGDFWTHKPGGTAVLKYNYQPSNDRIWRGEYVDISGNAGLSDTTYNSEIYFIVYNWYGLAIENYTVTGYDQNVLPNNAVIPQGITTIAANAFSGNTQLSQISIPESVTNIDSNAFENCTGLTSVTLSNNLTSIGSSAFKGCASLSSITIPDSVTNIDSNAFENCSYLQNITLSNNLTCIGSSAFKGCASLGSITIPDSVTNIDSNAFENCSFLQNIILSNNLTCIGGSAFKGCASLGSITIPNSVTNIDSNAFENCIELESVIVQRETVDITNLGTNVFDGCNSLGIITVPTNKTIDYRNAINWSNYSSLICCNLGGHIFTSFDLIEGNVNQHTAHCSCGFSPIVNHDSYSWRPIYGDAYHKVICSCGCEQNLPHDCTVRSDGFLECKYCPYISSQPIWSPQN